MSVEAVLLILVFFFLVFGIFLMPGKTFHNSGPRLGARLENHLAVGDAFHKHNRPVRWNVPKGPEPSGELQ